MLPFAGPKGSALSMLADILGGVLAGSAFAGDIRDMNTDFTAPSGVGHFFLAMKIEAFMPVAEFATRIPTTENLAIAIWQRLESKLKVAKLHRVRVYELPDLFVDFYGEP